MDDLLKSIHDNIASCTFNLEHLILDDVAKSYVHKQLVESLDCLKRCTPRFNNPGYEKTIVRFDQRKSHANKAITKLIHPDGITVLKRDATTVEKYKRQYTNDNPCINDEIKRMIETRIVQKTEPEMYKKFTKSLRKALKNYLAMILSLVATPPHRIYDNNKKQQIENCGVYVVVLDAFYHHVWGKSFSSCGLHTLINEPEWAPIKKLGLEPKEFEIITLMQIYTHFSDEHFRLTFSLRKRTICCLKPHISRQNIYKAGMDDRRHNAKPFYIWILWQCMAEDKSNIDVSKSPHENNMLETLNKLCHKEAKWLFELEEILNDEYTVNEANKLLKQNKPANHEEYVSFLKEKLIGKRITELKTLKLSHSVPELSNKEVDALTLGFRILLRRIFSDMAVKNDLDSKHWKDHIEIIALYAVYVAVLDELFHRKNRKCGIEILKHNLLRLSHGSRRRYQDPELRSTI